MSAVDLQASTLDLNGFILTDIHPKHDDTEGGKADLTFMCPIRTNPEAAIWNKSFVGAEVCFNSRDALGDDDKSPNDHVLKLKFRDDSRRLTVSLIGGANPLIDGKNADFLFAELTTKSRAAAVKIKVRVRGVDGDLVGKVFNQIGKPLVIRAEMAQQSLPLEGGKVVNFQAPRRAITPTPGSFVVGVLAADGSEFGGFVSEVYQDGEAEICKVLDLDDRVYPVTVAEIRSQHAVIGPKGKSADRVIADLKAQGKAQGIVLSYGDLLAALLEQFSGLAPTESKVLTQTVGQLTLKHAKDRMLATNADAEPTTDAVSQAAQA